MSRHTKPITMMPKEEQNEADDLNNLLYLLDTTPVVDYIGLAAIAQSTKEDPILNRLSRIVINGKTWISKSSPAKLQKFEHILPEITVAGNGVLFKGECIFLPETLQSLAISLAHRGSHPMQSGIDRRLRFHFFFHDMQKKVAEFVKTCQTCC